MFQAKHRIYKILVSTNYQCFLDLILNLHSYLDMSESDSDFNFFNSSSSDDDFNHPDELNDNLMFYQHLTPFYRRQLR